MDTTDHAAFDRLAWGFCDDTLTAAELSELEAAVCASPARRRRFQEAVALHASLAWAGDAPAAPPVPAAPAARRGPLRARAVAALAALAAAVAVAVVVLRPPPGVRNPPAPARPEALARVTEVEGAELVGADGRAAPVAPGEAVAAGHAVRTADAGRAVLLYHDGTRVEVGAASAVAPAAGGPGEAALVLEYGLVQAVAGPGAGRVVITTAHAVVRAATATLICTASTEETRVEVLAGRADVVRRADGRELELVAGRAVVTTRDGGDPLAPRRLASQVVLPRFNVRVSGGALSTSPDASRCATVTRDKVTVWDGRTGKELFSLPTLGRAVRGTAFAPNGVSLAATRDDDTVTTWTLGTPEAADAPTPPGPRDVVFSADGRFRAVGCVAPPARAVVQFARTPADPAPRVLDSGDSSVIGIAIAPGGKELAAGTPNRGVVVWDAARGAERATLRTDVRKRERAEAVAYSPDGRWLAAAFPGRRAVRVWDAVTLTERYTFSGQGRVFRSVAFSPNGRRVAAGTLDGTLFVWDAETGEERSCDKIDGRPVRFVTYSADGTTLTTVTESGLVQQWAAGTE